MELKRNICPNCFKNIKAGSLSCPYCSFDIQGYKVKTDVLPPFTMLNDQYLIGRVLGQGGFGITYKAMDTFDSNHRIVAVKEYMPSDYATRQGVAVKPLDSSKAITIFEHGKKSYIDEIKTLYQFRNNPVIVNIIMHFQENNTAYLVMEYLDGCSLKQCVKKHGDKLDPSVARSYIYDVAKALDKVHAAGVLHRDISPENIFLINNEKEVKLIDFGAARSYIENSDSEKSVLLKPGFAPPEQYSRKGNQGPWTDVYALAATLYYIVSGKYVPDSMSRMQNDTCEPLCNIVPGVSEAMSNAVKSAMEIDYSKRTQNCQQFMDDLDKTGWTTVRNVSITPEKPADIINVSPQPVVPKSKKRLICTVTCVSGNRVGTAINFYPGARIAVGRMKEICNFIVSDDKVLSKCHCYVEYDINRNCFYVTDVSTNGTYDQRGRRLIKNVREAFPPNSIVYLAREDIIIQFTVKLI